MRPAVLLVALAIGCAGHSEDASVLGDAGDAECSAWSRVASASYDLDADCRWSMRSFDPSRLRLTAVGADFQCIEVSENGRCPFGCERVNGLRPHELAEVWAAPGIDGAAALSLTFQSPCE